MTTHHRPLLIALLAVALLPASPAQAEETVTIELRFQGTTEEEFEVQVGDADTGTRPYVRQFGIPPQFSKVHFEVSTPQEGADFQVVRFAGPVRDPRIEIHDPAAPGEFPDVIVHEVANTMVTVPRYQGATLTIYRLNPEDLSAGPDYNPRTQILTYPLP